MASSSSAQASAGLRPEGKPLFAGLRRPGPARRARWATCWRLGGPAAGVPRRRPHQRVDHRRLRRHRDRPAHRAVLGPADAQLRAHPGVEQRRPRRRRGEAAGPGPRGRRPAHRGGPRPARGRRGGHRRGVRADRGQPRTRTCPSSSGSSSAGPARSRRPAATPRPARWTSRRRRPVGPRRGRSRLARPRTDAQPDALDPPGHLRDLDGAPVPLRRVRSGRRHRRARGQLGSPGRVGHRAVPLLRQAAGDHGHRRDHRRRGPPGHPGPGGRPRRRPGDPHGQRGPRAAGGGGQRAVVHDARRPGAGGVRPAGCPASPGRSRSWIASTCGWPPPARWSPCPASRCRTARSALWARLPDVLEMSAATLAILGDYVPFGIGQALGMQAGGNSLDNTLRMGTLVPTAWVLLDIRVARRGQRLRPRRGAPLGAGRHAAGHGQPVDDRALLVGRRTSGWGGPELGRVAAN